MNEFATEIKYKWPQAKRWTIQQCLVALGASISEVYATDRRSVECCESCGRPFRTLVPRNGAKGAIHQRYTKDELRDWVQELWKKAARWHPDKHLNKVKFYTEKFQGASEAYERAKKILKWHGA